MAIISALSVGSAYQNILFYTLLILLASVNLELLRHNSRSKKFGTVRHSK